MGGVRGRGREVRAHERSRSRECRAENLMRALAMRRGVPHERISTVETFPLFTPKTLLLGLIAWRTSGPELSSTDMNFSPLVNAAQSGRNFASD